MTINDILDRNFTAITEEYRKFALQKNQCSKCSLFNDYQTIVHSEGNAKTPTFMFIGESPGADEVSQERPFIGKAGQRLRQALRRHSSTFNRKTCLITNVICCRPKDNKFPRDKDGPWKSSNPSKILYKADDVINHCTNNWLHKEIEIVKPKVIITLGGQALRYIRNERGITHNRGSWLFLEQFRAWSFATYHPSYVIRCANLEDKRYIEKEFESDLDNIVSTWEQMIDNDPRMSMTHEEWLNELSDNLKIKSYLIKDRPLTG